MDETEPQVKPNERFTCDMRSAATRRRDFPRAGAYMADAA